MKKVQVLHHNENGVYMAVVHENENEWKDWVEVTTLVDQNKKMKTVITELLESAEYWSEYDVPIGIVQRMKESIN